MKVPILGEGATRRRIVSFEMEQMIMARISGPHVPEFVAAGDFAVHPYIVMERLAGKSLLPRLGICRFLMRRWPRSAGRRRPRRRPAPPARHPSRYQAEQFLFRPTGEAVLIDFGLSRHTQLPDLMQEEFRLPYGTAPYMAPEQLLGVRHDPRTDQFGLGVLLYFFSTGERPFGDSERLSVMKKRLWRYPKPPRALRPDYPPWLQEIVLRCLEVEPAWRYPTAAQLAFELSNHGQIKLTARSERLERDSFFTVMKRRFNPDLKKDWTPRTVATPLPAAPIIAVALDLTEEAKATNEALREAAAGALDRCRAHGLPASMC